MQWDIFAAYLELHGVVSALILSFWRLLSSQVAAKMEDLQTLALATTSKAPKNFCFFVCLFST